jgi:glutamate 5-kinase
VLNFSVVYMNHERKILTRSRLSVVKFGTGILTSSNGGLNAKRIKHYASQIAALQKKGRKVVIVSSGAIGAGMTRLRIHRRPTNIHDLQACAAVGQNLLMANYEKAFSQKRLTVAQILLTHEDFLHKERRQNAKNTILNILNRGIVPVINENDAVSFEEIKFGDNDQLASMVHQLLHADACIILSNVDGFLVRESSKSKPKVLSTIRTISKDIVKQAGGSGSHRSVGGMKSKILAARRVLKTRKPMIIANGQLPNVLTRLLKGEPLGTIFLP